jgi:hypothetical protein
MERTFCIFVLVALGGACGGSAGVVTSGGPGGAGGGAQVGGGAQSGGAGGGGSQSGGGGPGGSGGFSACDGPGQCILVEPQCCSSCAIVSLDKVIAIQAEKAEALKQSLGCGPGTPCPPCIGWIEPNGFGACEGGSCRVEDLRLHAASACQSDGECRLRWGAGCCEACGSFGGPDGGLVALATSGLAKLEALVCAPTARGCDECAPSYPAGAAAKCVQGHCQVVTTSSP